MDLRKLTHNWKSFVINANFMFFVIINVGLYVIIMSLSRFRVNLHSEIKNLIVVGLNLVVVT